MNNFALKELYLEKYAKLPSVNSLLKISLGLILFTIISTALVYAETMSVNVEGTSFNFEYVATGLIVDGVEPDSGFGSLLFTVDVTEPNATLNLVLERSFLDSTFDGKDDSFIIIDQFGEELFFTETTTSQSRTLNIELPLETVEIDVIGTSFNNPVTEPEVTEPEVTEPEVTEPEVTEPEVTDDAPKTQCGPGTVLKNGSCVLDERCGPGTILKNGACVLDPAAKSSSSSVKGMGKDLMMGFAIAFVAAGIVGVILGIVAKASKTN